MYRCQVLLPNPQDNRRAYEWKDELHRADIGAERSDIGNECGTENQSD